MKISYCDDTERGPGNGFLRCSEDDFPDVTWNVSIQRAVDQAYLSPEGEWLEPLTRFSLTGTLDGGCLSLPLLPSLVNALGTNDTYQIVLVSGTGQEKKARLHIDSIAYSPENPLENAVVVREEKKTVKAEPEPLPKPEPEPVQEPVQEPPAMPQASGRPEGRAKYARFLPVAILLLVLLCAASMAAYLFLKKDASAQTQGTSGEVREAKEVPAVAPASAKAPEKKADEAMSGSAKIGEPKAAGTPAPVQAKSLDDQVNAFFRTSGRSSAGAADLARNLSAKTPAEQDALFRLYYFACENGDTTLLFEYAACLDPSKAQWGTIEKNAPEAWRLYEKAAQQDPGRAEKARNDLKAWLLEQKEKGSARAGEWLSRLE